MNECWEEGRREEGKGKRKEMCGIYGLALPGG